MSFSDPIGDMLTRIRNALMREKTNVATPASQLRKAVLNVMQEEGYIRGFKETQDDAGHPQLKIELKYHNGEPVIQELSRVSKPGRRVYKSCKELPRIYNGLGIAVVSTSQGVLSDNAARQKNIGGEVLCKMF